MSQRTEFLRAVSREAWRGAILALGDDEAELSLLSRVVEAIPAGVVAATHPRPSVDRVVEAEGVGAVGLLAHPPDPDALVRLLEPYLQEEGDHPVPPDAGREERVVGTSPALTETYRRVARVADSTAPLLVAGESGTGKERVARALHVRSSRRDGPFVTVNCAALPEGLLEAELFGYERGAFTGAVGRSDGRFGRADGGTLFLDEVGEMGLALQAKLLRALETGEIDRLGSDDTVRVDVRIVAATNRELEERVREGHFREDLLYRLAVVRVTLPPLRERMEDLVPLIEYFVDQFSRRYGRPVEALSGKALAHLRERPWPGNVRQLRNVLDRAVLLARGGVVRSVDLRETDGPLRLSPFGRDTDAGYPVTFSLEEVEERHVRRVLAHTGGHLSEAAEILGIHRNTMTAKVREYGIDPDRPQARTLGRGA